MRQGAEHSSELTDNTKNASLCTQVAAAQERLYSNCEPGSETLDDYRKWAEELKNSLADYVQHQDDPVADYPESAPKSPKKSDCSHLGAGLKGRWF